MTMQNYSKRCIDPTCIYMHYGLKWFTFHLSVCLSVYYGPTYCLKYMYQSPYTCCSLVNSNLSNKAYYWTSLDFQASDCDWLKYEENREAVLAQVLYWLMSFFICSILKAFFYITESNLHRNKIFYIRKSTWSSMVQEAVTSKGFLLTSIDSFRTEIFNIANECLFKIKKKKQIKQWLSFHHGNYQEFSVFNELY